MDHGYGRGAQIQDHIADGCDVVLFCWLMTHAVPGNLALLLAGKRANSVHALLLVWLNLRVTMMRASGWGGGGPSAMCSHGGDGHAMSPPFSSRDGFVTFQLGGFQIPSKGKVFAALGIILEGKLSPNKDCSIIGRIETNGSTTNSNSLLNLPILCTVLNLLIWIISTWYTISSGIKIQV